jgi:serine/threonine-protein kinase
MSDPSFEDAATLPPEAAPGAPEEPWVGRVLDGRYRLLRKLGEGGMGAVFLAEHVALRKEVALKTIHASFDGHAEIAARFAREAMVSARIEHPHVVSALDYGFLTTGGAYLVMQLAKGESLRKYLQREGVFPWEVACQLVEQMADAVAAAHDAGIVHRDLKPENVVVEAAESKTLQIKVLDFGIAHLRVDPAGGPSPTPGAKLTRLGTIIGTPGYMSPEQAVGEPVDERTDIYALGVILWELLAGRRPFEGQSLTEIVTKQFANAPPGLPESTQSIPAELPAYLTRMLATRAEDRPQSASEVRDWLRALRAPQSQPRAEHAPLAKLRTRLLAAPTSHKALLAVTLLLLLAWTFSGSEPAPRGTEPRHGRNDTATQSAHATATETEHAETDPADADPEKPSPKEAGSARNKGNLRTRVRRGINAIFH